MAMKSRLALTGAAAVLTALLVVYFVASGPQAESLRRTEDAGQEADGPSADLETPTPDEAREDVATETHSEIETTTHAQPIELVSFPESTLSVIDANTLVHLENVELACVSHAQMSLGSIPGTFGYSSLGAGLTSPIAFRGAHDPTDEHSFLRGVTFGPADDPLPGSEIDYPFRAKDGFRLYARAPGYAWEAIAFEHGRDHEIQLTAGASLSVRVTNLQLDRYEALEAKGSLYIWRKRDDGYDHVVRFQDLDESLETEGQVFEGIQPGELTVSVDLGQAYSFRRRVALAREEFTLEAGERREVVLNLESAPLPAERVNLGGVVSFPRFEGSEDVELQISKVVSFDGGRSDIEVALKDLEPVGGSPPGWAFRFEGLDPGEYQVLLWPLLTSWMIELPEGGREDYEFTIPELAEVEVETVDESTGERVPLRAIYHGHRGWQPGVKPHRPFRWLDCTEPGLFRFRTAVGPAYLETPTMDPEVPYGVRFLDLDLSPGHQKVRFEMGPPNVIDLDFRDGDKPLVEKGKIYYGLHPQVRALGHEGKVSDDRTAADRLIEVDAPGRYELTFDGVGGDRFLPVPPQQVDVRAGERTSVIVHLRRK